MTTSTKDEIESGFLAAELDTGYSMLRIAQGEARTQPDCQAALVIARAALSGALKEVLKILARGEIFTPGQTNSSPLWLRSAWIAR